MRTYIRFITALSNFGGLVAALLLASAVIIVCQMIVVRYFLNDSTVWQTEFVIYALVAATFLGSGYVLIRKGHVGVDILPRAIGGTGELMLKLLANFLSIVFLAIVTWSGWQYFHEAWAGNWTTDTVWALPLWIPLLPLPVGLAMLILQYIAEMMQLIIGEDDSPTALHGVDLDSLEVE